jgi:hypothetical protein
MTRRNSFLNDSLRRQSTCNKIIFADRMLRAPVWRAFRDERDPLFIRVVAIRVAPQRDAAMRAGLLIWLPRFFVQKSSWPTSCRPTIVSAPRPSNSLDFGTIEAATDKAGNTIELDQDSAGEPAAVRSRFRCYLDMA